MATTREVLQQLADLQKPLEAVVNNARYRRYFNDETQVNGGAPAAPAGGAAPQDDMMVEGGGGEAMGEVLDASVMPGETPEDVSLNLTVQIPQDVLQQGLAGADQGAGMGGDMGFGQPGAPAAGGFPGGAPAGGAPAGGMGTQFNARSNYYQKVSNARIFKTKNGGYDVFVPVDDSDSSIHNSIGKATMRKQIRNLRTRPTRNAEANGNDLSLSTYAQSMDTDGIKYWSETNKSVNVPGTTGADTTVKNARIIANLLNKAKQYDRIVAAANASTLSGCGSTEPTPKQKDKLEELNAANNILGTKNSRSRKLQNARLARKIRNARIRAMLNEEDFDDVVEDSDIGLEEAIDAIAAVAEPLADAAGVSTEELLAEVGDMVGDDVGGCIDGDGEIEDFDGDGDCDVCDGEGCEECDGVGEDADDIIENTRRLRRALKNYRLARKLHNARKVRSARKVSNARRVNNARFSKAHRIANAKRGVAVNNAAQETTVFNAGNEGLFVPSTMPEMRK